MCIIDFLFKIIGIEGDWVVIGVGVIMSKIMELVDVVFFVLVVCVVGGFVICNMVIVGGNLMVLYFYGDFVVVLLVFDVRLCMVDGEEISFENFFV